MTNQMQMRLVILRKCKKIDQCPHILSTSANVRINLSFLFTHVRTLGRPDESISRLVLFVILGVLTLGISNLIWYIYLKCQSNDKGTYLHTCTRISRPIVNVRMYIAIPFVLYVCYNNDSK